MIAKLLSISSLESDRAGGSSEPVEPVAQIVVQRGSLRETYVVEATLARKLRDHRDFFGRNLTNHQLSELRREGRIDRSGTGIRVLR